MITQDDGRLQWPQRNGQMRLPRARPNGKRHRNGPRSSSEADRYNASRNLSAPSPLLPWPGQRASKLPRPRPNGHHEWPRDVLQLQGRASSSHKARPQHATAAALTQRFVPAVEFPGRARSSASGAANDAVIQRPGSGLRGQVDDQRRSRAKLATPGTALSPGYRWDAKGRTRISTCGKSAGGTSADPPPHAAPGAPKAEFRPAPTTGKGPAAPPHMACHHHCARCF